MELVQRLGQTIFHHYTHMFPSQLPRLRDAAGVSDQAYAISHVFVIVGYPKGLVIRIQTPL